MASHPESAPFLFPPDTKFAAIHLTHCSCTGLPARLSLDDKLFVTTSPVLELTEMDRSRIGRDYAEAFDKSNMVIVAARPSSTPGILDQESLDLEAVAYMLLYSIFMIGFPNFWPGVLTLGSRSGSGAAWANRIALINDLYRHGDAIPYRITVETLRQAHQTVPGLESVFRKGEDFVRVRRGMNAMIDGWKQRSVLGRLHASVQALDGLMKLEKGEGESQFAARVALIAQGTRLHETAIEIYRLRSFQEHLSDWPPELAYVKPNDRPRFVSHRSFQAEILAGAAYRAVLLDPMLRHNFRDSSLDAFWAGGGWWTAKTDLDAETARFHYSAEE